MVIKFMVSQTRPHPLFSFWPLFLLNKQSKEHVIDTAEIQEAVVQFFFVRFDSNGLCTRIYCAVCGLVQLCTHFPVKTIIVHLCS